MARSVVFKTPGLIDMRSFTVFGLNAKPNVVSPFGFFGTGLKYAVAVLLRAGCTIIVWRGKDQYEFYAKDTDFRGKDFVTLHMRRSTWLSRTLKVDDTELPFTIELGKNWEIWQAFRELESNTRDENGATAVWDSLETFVPLDDTTHIIVTGEAFVQEYYDMDKTFLPLGLTVRDSSDKMQVLNRPSQYLYYRGVRVADLAKPTLFTYNVLSQLTLTEDRTLKYSFQVDQVIGQHISRSTDLEVIGKVVTAKDENFEHSLKWDVVYDSPSEEFKQVLRQTKRANPGARAYYGAYAPKMPPKPDPLAKHPGPFTYKPNKVGDLDGIVVLDADDHQIMTMHGEWEVLVKVVEVLNKHKDK